MVYMIDDINMAQKDKYGHQSALELLRQWFDHKGWFNKNNMKIYLKTIKQVCFAASLSARQQVNNVSKSIADERFSWHMAGIGFTNFEGCHLEQIYKIILSKVFMNSPNKLVMSQAPISILKSSLEFIKMYNSTIRPSPTGFLKRINQRHMFYILKGIIEIPLGYYKMIENVAFLWMNEICRTVLDRFQNTDEKAALYEKTKLIAAKNFKVREKIFPTLPDEPYFCYGLPD